MPNVVFMNPGDMKSLKLGEGDMGDGTNPAKRLGKLKNFRLIKKNGSLLEKGHRLAEKIKRVADHQN